MIRRASTIRPLPALIATLLLAAAVAGRAAVPVEESVPSGGSAPPPQSIDSREISAPPSNQLSELFYQLQVLQQEVQELRGMLEEQGHRLDRLARDQQEQYLDLDRRMQALRSGGGQGAGGPALGAGGSEPGAPDGAGGADFSGTGGGSGGASERDAYTAAFELMKQRRFDESAQAFQALVEQYPNGAYTPNAFYWLGELYLAQDDNEAARQSFAQVVNLYPDHQKVPDALYKLGVAYHRLGDTQRAREYLNRVRSEYPQSSAAGLAQTYLAEL